MKKLYVLFLVIFAAVILSCSALDRVNPTDPQASNYVGMHYLGNIGDFSGLEDFSVMGDVIWCVDSPTSRVFKYDISGDLDFSFTGGGLTAPTGICNDNTYFYVADESTYAGNLKRFYPEYVSDPAQVQFPNYYYSADPEYKFIKCAASTTLLFAATATKIYRFDTAGNTMTGGFYDDPVSPLNISDIKYNAATDEVVVADSASDRLIVLSTALVFKREMPFTFDISGFAIKDNYLYVPSEAGIRQFYFDSGIIVKTFADYGEGSGKITAPGACGVYGDYVLVGTGSTIKYFGP